MKNIRDGVWFVQGENKGRYPFSHSLYVEGEKNLLIDTGAGPALEELVPKTDQVALSHYHRDHVTFNHLFREALFMIHRDDAPGVETLEGFLALSGLDLVDIEAYWKMVRQYNFTATGIERYLGDGDTIDLGRNKITVVHLPGHTPGHCGFLIEKYNLIYASDIDLSSFGPWYGNPSSDPDQFRCSIRRLRDLKPDILVTGHCDPVYNHIDQKLAAYESVLDQRDEAILAQIRKQPATLEELTAKKIIYRRHNGQEVLRFFEKSMVLKHLESMIKKGIAFKTEDELFLAL
jgi:glyoxylase-like metal-dependent hydrolase (beta-lactamase superfamily II)